MPKSWRSSFLPTRRRSLESFLSRTRRYLVGGISPFGTRKPLLVYIEASILELTRIYINGGKRGFLVGLSPRAVVDLLQPTPVSVAIDI